MVMSEADCERDEQIRDAARQLAARLATEDGRRAIAHAAEATRRRTVDMAEAARLDPRVLLKCVTPLRWR